MAHTVAIFQAVRSLFSEEVPFVKHNGTYESIILPEGYTKPTKEAYDEVFTRYLNIELFKELRQERNKRLAEVDWVFSTDYHISSEERGVWVAYRQALRDLPSTTDDPSNPMWPTKPSIPKGTTLNVDLKSINDEEVSENAQIVLLQNVVFSLTKRIEALENA
jgi:hypothetical protein